MEKQALKETWKLFSKKVNAVGKKKTILRNEELWNRSKGR